eukprot:TRINITY_DN6835_c0_g1_i4.p1 TRINITY_DN6835_c0_g1~~TRINITY_DN6835_c0_g1_i4.p1  ORF type:complete len:298 (-),score=120.07 TRINITY_DN6835_c0_g1_i4:79-972(-)
MHLETQDWQYQNAPKYYLNEAHYIQKRLEAETRRLERTEQKPLDLSNRFEALDLDDEDNNGIDKKKKKNNKNKNRKKSKRKNNNNHKANHPQWFDDLGKLREMIFYPRDLQKEGQDSNDEKEGSVKNEDDVDVNGWRDLVDRSVEDQIEESQQFNNQFKTEGGEFAVLSEEQLESLNDDEVKAIRVQLKDLVSYGNEKELALFMCNLDPNQRAKLVGVWILETQRFTRGQVTLYSKRMTDVVSELEELERRRHLDVLKNATVIGMTTTGAAKNREILKEVGCEIVVVEEAAGKNCVR